MLARWDKDYYGVVEGYNAAIRMKNAVAGQANRARASKTHRTIQSRAGDADRMTPRGFSGTPKS